MNKHKVKRVNRSYSDKFQRVQNMFVFCGRRMNTLLLLFSMAFIAIACNNEWDDHYDRSGALPDKNLMQIIRDDGSLSKFVAILEATGLDSLLSSDHSYTVWAPVDEALADVDMSDIEALERLVKNHLARYTNPASMPQTQRISMLNGKPMYYGGDGTFNGVELVENDIQAKNGLLHKLKMELPYKYNILEYMQTHPDYSKPYAFIEQFIEPLYDATLSTTYDSVFVDYNPLLADKIYGIGEINCEDSIYTMIIPDNSTWELAYERISPYFNAYSADDAVADSIQHVQTSLAILSGLTFRGRIENPAAYDSLITVTGNVIRPTGEYFNGYTCVEASNGIIYTTGGMFNFNDTCVWNHTICVEAEDMDYRINLSGTNSYIRTTDINSLVAGVSDNSYLEVSSGNVDGGVIFDIPNTLSGKYDVYVDFVAPLVDGEALANELTKVVFQLKYLNEKGRSSTKNNNTATVVGGAENNGIISVKAFEAVELPVSDYYDAMWFLTEGNSISNISERTTLQVKTKVNNSDAKKGYLRKFRVDRVRFVPVTE